MSKDFLSFLKEMLKEGIEMCGFLFNKFVFWLILIPLFIIISILFLFSFRND